jgi:CDP-4-dehydro-6-deoxyglucose reductase
MQTFTSKLINKKQLTPHVSLLQFSTQNAPDFTFQAGQYIIIHVPQPDGSTARRLYSIASPASQKGIIELVIEIVPEGVGSQYVEQLNNGDEVTLQGPAGLFTLKEQDFSHSGQAPKGRDPESITPVNTTDQNNKASRSIIFLATGTGIAPIRSMIQTVFSHHPPSSSPVSNSQLSHPNSYHLLWGLKYYKDTYFVDEFIDLAQRHDNFSFSVCLSQEQNLDMIDTNKKPYFHLGRMTKILTSNIQNPNSDFYLCGGRLVVEDIKNNLLEKGITKNQLHFEKF